MDLDLDSGPHILTFYSVQYLRRGALVALGGLAPTPAVPPPGFSPTFRDDVRLVQCMG